MSEKKPIKSLAQFLEWTEQFKAGEYLFRGLPNADWKNKPSTYLRLDKDRQKDRQNVGMLIKINKELLEDARRLGYGTRDGDPLSDLELLADLQHRRAATCLIDFTDSAFVALWFACQTSSKGEADGKVFAVCFKDPAVFKTVTSSESKKDLEYFFGVGERPESSPSHESPASQGHPSDSSSDTGRLESLSGRKPLLHHWQPRPVNDSITTQKSNFIFGDPQVIKEVVGKESVIIDQSSKSKILESLEKSSGINEETIFPGLDNFARRSSYDRPYNEPDAQDYIGRGIDAHMESEFDAAINYYSEAIELNPNDATAYGNRGIAHAKKGAFVKAIRDFDKAIELDINNAVSYHNRGAVYVMKDELDAAIADFNRAIKLNPKDAQVYKNRGAAYFKKDDFDAAIADLNRAIELNPKYAEVYSDRGAAYFRKDDFDAAIADLNRAIELNPKYAAAYSIRGAVYAKTGDSGTAIADCSKAIELNPKYADAYKNRSSVYAKIGEYEKARQDREKAAEIEQASGGVS